MNYPWQPGVNPGDDVDSLQADVMRFIAIFGLCLAAIFSLVREVEHDYTSAEAQQSVAVEPEQPVVTESIVREYSRESLNHEPQRVSSLQPQTAQQAPLPEPALEPEPQPEQPEPETRDPVAQATPAPEQGFTLQFGSSAILHALMVRGAIQVYARSGDTYRMMDSEGRLREARPPAAYYGMDSATLPGSIRAVASGLEDLEGVEWVVTLPESTTRGIVELVSAHSNGVLIIGADASVRRHEPF